MDCLPTRKRGKKTKISHPLLKERHAKKTKQKKKKGYQIGSDELSPVGPFESF
jgi:hypothetical protein